MSSVLTLIGYTPPARFDDLPWTQARIESSSTETGSYTLFATLDLDPIDDNPELPLTRSFTVEDATTGNWYRVTFLDEDGDESEPFPPVENTAGVAAFATAAELAALLNVNATTNADALDRVLLASAGMITTYVGRSDLAGWEVALATQENLNHAAELWKQMKLEFGVILGEIPVHTAQDTFQRHRNNLVCIKSGSSFGFA